VSYVKNACGVSADDLTKERANVKARASEALTADGIPANEQECVFQADLRYAGQAFQLSIDFTEAELQAKGLALLIEQFDAEHTQLFTFALDEGHEIVMLRAVVQAKAKAIAEMKLGTEGTTLEDAIMHKSRFYYEGKWHDINIYNRGLMHSGLVVVGPAIVQEMDSTTVVLPGYKANVDKVGNLLLNPV